MAGTLEVLFRHRPLREFDCEAILDTVREVFRANGIDVDLQLGGAASLSAAQMEAVRVNGCSVAILEHLEMFSLVPMASPNQACVFIVEKISDRGSGPFAGCAAHPADKAGLVLTEAAARGGLQSSAGEGRWVLAHELVHVLGIPSHDDDRTKLMHESATGITSSMPRIDSVQKTRIEGSQYLGRNFAPGARALPSRTTPERSTPSAWDSPRSYFDQLPR